MARRDYGARIDRQKARLMWMVEDMGTDKFRELIGEYMGGVALRKGIHPKVCLPVLPSTCLLYECNVWRGSCMLCCLARHIAPVGNMV